ncbi:MAG: hypothetical protein R3C05_28650 [Pirellulaceae bacterium]
MSTVSTSLNSSATLVMSDFYRRLIRPDASDQSQVNVLRAATIAWGAMGTIMALALVQLTESALDIWWTLSSVLGAGIVGLFLLGITVTSIRGRDAILVLMYGMLVIAYMTLSTTSYWPKAWRAYANPLHPYLIIVVGPSLMILLGGVIAKLRAGGHEAKGSS